MSEPEDHHHYRRGKRRASGKDATETTEENTVLNGNVPAATDVGRYGRKLPVG
ncbi:hypothetical protein O9992_19680 [Vibrio lentus]|nr:hypothetical protein [Vibrio lentus]